MPSIWANFDDAFEVFQGLLSSFLLCAVDEVGYCWILIIAKPQLYSSKLFCHVVLEAYISIYSSLILRM